MSACSMNESGTCTPSCSLVRCQSHDLTAAAAAVATTPPPFLPPPFLFPPFPPSLPPSLPGPYLEALIQALEVGQVLEEDERHGGQEGQDRHHGVPGGQGREGGRVRGAGHMSFILSLAFLFSLHPSLPPWLLTLLL